MAEAVEIKTCPKLQQFLDYCDFHLLQSTKHKTDRKSTGRVE